MPVGVGGRKEAEVDRTGVAKPMSTPTRVPNVEEPADWQVTTARPRPLVPRSGSMATAMGFWSTATVPIVRVPMGLAVSGVRSIVLTVLEPVFAMTARFVSWVMATPLGLVPTVTTIGFGGGELSG